MTERICKLDNGVEVVLDVGPPHLRVDFIWADLSIVILVGRPTSIANIVWLRMVSINWHWPFIHHVANFMDRNMGEEDEDEDERTS